MESKWVYCVDETSPEGVGITCDAPEPKLEDLLVDASAADAVADDLACPVCLELLNDATILTTCGHTLCNTCIQKLYQSASVRKKCPVCRRCLRKQSAACQPNWAIRKIVSKIHVKCKYSVLWNKDTRTWLPSQGPTCCDQVLPVTERSAHSLTCKFSLLPCPFRINGCDEILTRLNLEDHRKICPFREVQCTCGSSSLAKNWSAHLKVCNRQVVNCPHHKYGCSFDGQRGLLAEHLRTCRFEAVRETLEGLEHRNKTLQLMNVKFAQRCEQLLLEKGGEQVFLKRAGSRTKMISLNVGKDTIENLYVKVGEMEGLPRSRFFIVIQGGRVLTDGQDGKDCLLHSVGIQRDSVVEVRLRQSHVTVDTIMTSPRLTILS